MSTTATLFSPRCQPRRDLLSSYRPSAQHDLEVNQAVTIDAADLGQNSGVPDILDQLRDRPQVVLASLGLAAHEVTRPFSFSGRSTQTFYFFFVFQVVRSHAHGDDEPARIHVMVSNLEPLTALRDLKSTVVNKFVALRGTVVRVSNIRPIVTVAEFECAKCDGLQTLRIEDGRFAQPTHCSASGSCRSKSFIFRRGSPATQTQDWQRIRWRAPLLRNAFSPTQTTFFFSASRKS